MPLVSQPFAETFDFARARAAGCLDAAGAPVTLAEDEPRFDHDEAGAPRGLLVEGRPQFGAADKLTVKAGDWAAGPGTVLHACEDSEGGVRRQARYVASDPRTVANAFLNAKGRHRTIAYVPGYLPNRGGFVRWRNQMWSLGGVIMAEAGVGIEARDGVMLLEG